MAMTDRQGRRGAPPRDTINPGRGQGGGEGTAVAAALICRLIYFAIWRRRVGRLVTPPRHSPSPLPLATPPRHTRLFQPRSHQKIDARAFFPTGTRARTRFSSQLSPLLFPCFFFLFLFSSTFFSSFISLLFLRFFSIFSLFLFVFPPFFCRRGCRSIRRTRPFCPNSLIARICVSHSPLFPREFPRTGGWTRCEAVAGAGRQGLGRAILFTTAQEEILQRSRPKLI
jgi:hypothetical protein